MMRSQWVEALVSTHRRRRLVALLLILATVPVWATVSGGPITLRKVTLDVAAPDVISAIKANRPLGYEVGGIDISSHDHGRNPLQWGTELAVDSRFVYIKATEGSSYVNPHFGTDYATALDVHRYVGAYAFARPDKGDPVGQANFFLAHAQFNGGDRTLIPFVDLEWPYGSIRTNDCYNLTPAQMRDWIHAFVGRIEAGIGRKPMIYTIATWWNPCTGSDTSMGSYPLDVAFYKKEQSPRLPAGWSTFTLWQYAAGESTQDGRDRDVVNGGLAGLQALT
jgi:GH25 family lysozyme M1 (1,4-beta-N-acetylmuramidase)